MSFTAYVNSSDNNSQVIPVKVLQPPPVRPVMAIKFDGSIGSQNAIVNAFLEENRAKAGNVPFEWTISGGTNPDVGFKLASASTATTLNCPVDSYYVTGGYSSDGTTFTEEELTEQFTELADNVMAVGAFALGPFDTNYVPSD